MTFIAGKGQSKPASAMRRACATVGIDPTGATLLHHSSNAIYHLPTRQAVARVTVGKDAEARVRRTADITRWLADNHQFPVTRPLPDTAAVTVDAVTVVSFWTYYPPPEHVWTPSSAELAILLRSLHQLARPSLPLPAWVPLASLHATIDDDTLSASLTQTERRWIRTRIDEVRRGLAGLVWPLGTGLIHGDAWAGNLLPCPTATPAGAVLGDWDWVSIGPREVDLIPTWHAATRYGKGPSWTRAFIDRYGYDLADWDGYPALMTMRDLVQLTGPIRRANEAPQYRNALRQRLDSLRNADTTAVWTAR